MSEPFDFIALCNEKRDEGFKTLQDRLATLEVQKTYAPTMRRLSIFFPDARFYALPTQTHFDVSLKEMKAIEPALRLIEDELGVEFAESKDYAAEKYASREFRTKCGKIVVNVSIHGDQPNCRSVPDGEETMTVKKYKLVCDE